MKTRILGLLTIFLLFASYNLSGTAIGGTLTGPDGEGISFHPIQVKAAFVNGETATLQTHTDETGSFLIGLNAGTESISFLLFSFLDCNGERAQKRIMPESNTSLMEIDLRYCERTGNGRCAVRVERNRTNSGDLLLKALPRGEPPFSFLWSDGSSDRTTVVPPNTAFCVTVTDATGCKARFCSGSEIVDNCRLTIRRVPSATGLGVWLEAHLRPSDSVANYNWSTGDTTQSILVDEPGLYCVRAWSDEGCFASKCIRIGRPDRPDSDCIDARMELRRVAGSNLAQLVVVYDQLIPLDFEWNTGEISNPITVDETGHYSVTITHPGEDCQVVLRKYVNLNPCNISIAVRPTNRGYALTVMGLPEWTSTENEGLQWNTGETSRTIFVPNLQREYCVTFRSPRCYDRACVRRAAGITERSVDFRVRPSDRDNLMLVSASTNGDEYAEWIWSDGTKEPTRVVENNAALTAYAYFGDGEMISGDLILGNKISEEFRVSAFPNPADHSVTLNWSNELNSTTVIRVFDPTGKFVQEYKLDRSDQQFRQFTFETGELNTGLHWINIVSGGLQESVPLMILRK